MHLALRMCMIIKVCVSVIQNYMHVLVNEIILKANCMNDTHYPYLCVRLPDSGASVYLLWLESL